MALEGADDRRSPPPCRPENRPGNVQDQHSAATKTLCWPNCEKILIANGHPALPDGRPSSVLLFCRGSLPNISSVAQQTVVATTPTSAIRTCEVSTKPA